MKNNSSHVARLGRANSSPPSQQWTQFLAGEENLGFQQLEVKREVIDANMSSDSLNFGVMLESPVDHSFVNPPLLTGVQRYHSAPSSLLRSLSSLIAQDASIPQVSGPLGSSSNRTSSYLSPFLSHGLAAITEQMDTEKLTTTGGTKFFEEFDQYMCNPSNFGARAAHSAAMVHSGKSEAANWQVPNNVLVPDPFESFFPSPKSRSHATQLTSAAARQDAEESSPSGMAVHSMMSSEESISGTSEDTNYYGHGSKAPMKFSRDDSFLLSDTLTSLNLPTTPGDVNGKHYCGIQLGEAKMSCETVEGPMRSNPGVAGSLKRHMSLPVARTQVKSGLEDISFVQPISYGTRAKRGCATHPRSIAERIRRTRISERMKKLQQVVPNMDKQTNTSEMLDEAVEYVKSLQKEVQELTNTVANLRGQNHV